MSFIVVLLRALGVGILAFAIIAASLFLGVVVFYVVMNIIMWSVDSFMETVDDVREWLNEKREDRLAKHSADKSDESEPNQEE